MSAFGESWIRNQPVAAFFGLSIAICYGTLFPAAYLLPRDTTAGQILGFYLGRIGIFSPVIAGMAVARVLEPGRRAAPFARRLRILLPAWVAASIVSIADLNLTAPPDVPLAGLFLLSLPAALLPAWLLSSALAGPPSAMRMLSTLLRPRGSIWYYVAALSTFPVVHIVGSIATNGLRNGNWIPPAYPGGDNMAAVFITFCSVLLFSGGLNEESGWRGFAQRRLQAKYSPLATALILWFGMVIWHIPNDLLQYAQGGYIQVRLGLYPFITILFCWIYIRTQGSILPVALFHASMNAMNPLMGIFPITAAGNCLLVGFAVCVILLDRMWRPLPGNHAAVYAGGAAGHAAELAG